MLVGTLRLTKPATYQASDLPSNNSLTKLEPSFHFYHLPLGFSGFTY